MKTIPPPHALLLGLILVTIPLGAQEYEEVVSPGPGGILIYRTGSRGDRLVDFSFCGYRAGEADIPEIPARLFIPWQEEDATALLREAMAHMESLDPDSAGFRGAIQLDSGVFRLSGRLDLSVSGVVIRGMGPESTTLLATGEDRETLLRVEGEVLQSSGPQQDIREYVPVNAMRVPVEKPGSFSVGDEVRITRPVTQSWIDTLGMNSFGNPKEYWLGWKDGRNTMCWNRTVKDTDCTSISLDAPLTTALDPCFGGAWIEPLSPEGLVEKSGIELLSLESEFHHPMDEDHCWNAISFQNARDCWVRQVNFRGFAGSAVATYKECRRLTVEDCISTGPVSEIAGERRHTFFTEGEQILFQRCWSEEGYHDFAAGNFAAGPNAFLQCETRNSHSYSGTIDRWASGVLFDLVFIDGQALSLKNLGYRRRGAGWSAGNCMLWQCQAALIACWSPPTASNHAYGTWGQFEGNGDWFDSNSHIRPISLYAAQLRERTGEAAMNRCRLRINSLGSTTSPDPQQALQLTRNAANPPPSLKEWIQAAPAARQVSTGHEEAMVFRPSLKDSSPLVKREGVRIQGGWITVNGEVITGSVKGVKWWNGTTRPYDSERAGFHLTRFVPGKKGSGLTDDLEEVVDSMLEKHIAAIDHNYGLWYDRRRDDHTRGRQMDADAWAPFYELPFARSGRGAAWDGLSLYDLEKPNPWYWRRLKEFADRAASEGLLLIHQNYFQHNILEAGAHFADYPWRTFNNINHTGFPEPIPYAGDKRIYLAEQYYDTTHAGRKELHRLYIRQCLDAFGDNSNVIQHISEEFTGPLHFTEFWLDEIGRWQDEKGRKAIIGLGATRDVQDGILEDPGRAARVDLIDIKYWKYRDDGSLYAPAGGQNLAPRQHARLMDPGKQSFESVHRAVSEYRLSYPGKAVTYSWPLEASLQWAVFMGGGSMAAIPRVKDPEFLKAAAGMLPEGTPSGETYRLTNQWDEQIIYSTTGTIPVSFRRIPGAIRVCWLNPQNGEVGGYEELEVKKKEIKLLAPGEGPVVAFIRNMN